MGSVERNDACMILAYCKGQMYTEGLREGCERGDRLILHDTAFRDILQAQKVGPKDTIF